MRPCRNSFLPLFFLVMGIGCGDAGQQKSQDVISGEAPYGGAAKTATDTIIEPNEPVIANDIVPVLPNAVVLPPALPPTILPYVPRLGGGGGERSIRKARLSSEDDAKEASSIPFCPRPNSPCVRCICDDAQGCIQEDLPIGTACDDGNPCTIGDSCQSGICTGNLQDCKLGLDESCQIGFCDAADGCRVINLTGPYGADCMTPFLGICAIGAGMCIDGILTAMCEPLVRPGDKLEECGNELDDNCDGNIDCCVANGTFVPGSIQGQDGWTGGTVPISLNVDQAVTQPTPNGANNGIGSWRVSNSTINGNHNGNFAGWPFSPGLAVTAGQPSSGAGADRFTATIFFRSANAVADGSNIEVDLGTSTGDQRNSFLAITNRADADGGLQLRAVEPDGATGNFKPTQIIATNILRTAWHRIDIVANFFNGIANDTWQVSLDGVVLTNPLTMGTTFGTFEGISDFNMSPYLQTNRLLFRSGAAPSAFGPFVDNAAQGFFFDDVCYSASNQANPGFELDSYAASFEPMNNMVNVTHGAESVVAEQGPAKWFNAPAPR